jgi:hypothetical protein
MQSKIGEENCDHEHWINFQRESSIIEIEKFEELQLASREFDESSLRKPAVIKVLDNTTKNKDYEVQYFSLPF